MNLKKVLIVFILFIVFALFSVVFSLINLGNNKIYSNVQIQGINVSGKTQEDVNNDFSKKYGEKKLAGIKIVHNDY